MTISSPSSRARPGRTNARYLRIVGECRKLGVTVSATTVRNALRRHRLSAAPRTSGPSWSEFLRAQAAGTLARDFSHVDTVMLRRVYVMFFIDLERRVVFLAGVTAHPAGPWVTQQARNLVATMEDKGRDLRFLVRDRDCLFRRVRETASTWSKVSSSVLVKRFCSDRWPNHDRAPFTLGLLVARAIPAARGTVGRLSTVAPSALGDA
jgi:hypothetical protein